MKEVAIIPKKVMKNACILHQKNQATKGRQ